MASLTLLTYGCQHIYNTFYISFSKHWLLMALLTRFNPFSNKEWLSICSNSVDLSFVSSFSSIKSILWMIHLRDLIEENQRPWNSSLSPYQHMTRNIAYLMFLITSFKCNCLRKCSQLYFILHMPIIRFYSTSFIKWSRLNDSSNVTFILLHLMDWKCSC